MRRSGLGVVLLMSFMALTTAACGGGDGSTATSLPLTARVIQRGEFKGYTPGAPESFNSPNAYLAVNSGLSPGQRDAWIARLTSEGFKTDLTEYLNGAQGPQTGLSGVMQFGSTASAQAEFAAERRFDTQGQNEFPVKAIPGAVGWGFSRPSRGGENVLFADGPFLYLVGYGWYGTAHNPKHSALIDATTKLYTRVHGQPAG